MYNLKIYILIVSFVFAVDYQSQIQPIWDANCTNCHGYPHQHGDLILFSHHDVINSGIVVPGDASSSILYDRITLPESANGDMPPSGSLSQSEIDLIAEWINEGALFEESNDVAGCMDPNAIACEDEIDTLYFPECITCSDSDPCDNYYNPNATIDNGLCMYDVVPEEFEFIIEYIDSPDLDQDDWGFNLDWSAFTPPVEITQYTLQRCLDPDGDSDGDGIIEYENCVMIIPINSGYLETSFLDNYTEDILFLKYTLYVHYPSNNFWGSAHGYYYYEETSGTLGDVNGDETINVVDIVLIVNHVLDTAVLDSTDQLWAADYNGDGTINVVDIVGVVNLILN